MIAGKTLQAWLDRADALGGEGKFFEAHEELELAWKEAAGDEKLLLQAVIQLAAGLHRLRHVEEKREGADYLLAKGLEKLALASGLLQARPLQSLVKAIESVKEGRQAPKTLRFGLRLSLSEDER